MLVINEVLTDLDLSDNKVGDPGVQVISEMLEKNITLKILSLGSNGIQSSGAKILSKAILRNPSLTALYLNNNEIGDEGAKSLSRVINNRNIKTLNLQRNKIGESGAVDLFRALQTNTTMIELDLQNNSIDEGGVKALCDMIAKNSTLKKLVINDVGLGNRGVQSLSLVLVMNSSLTELHISCNKIDDSGIEPLCGALRINSTLSKLYMLSNQISDAGVRSLCGVLDSNSSLTELKILSRAILDDKFNEKLAQNEARSEARKRNKETREQEQRRTEEEWRRRMQGMMEMQNQMERARREEEQEHERAEMRQKEREEDWKRTRQSLLSDRLFVNIDQLRIERSNYVGDGSFGCVYRGEYAGAPIALKEIKDRRNLTPEMLEIFEREAELLSNLQHPNIVRFMGITNDYGIVSEFCHGGDLYKILHAQKRVFTLPQVVNIAKGIACGLAFLHGKKIIHGDVKSGNVLMTTENIPKVADFGYSQTRNSTLSLTNREVGTPRWMAPEMLRAQPHNIKADVYSFGLIVWELVTNKVPFSKYDRHGLYVKVGMEGETISIPQNIPAELADVIKSCCHPDHHRRPMMSEVVETLEELSGNPGSRKNGKDEGAEGDDMCTVCFKERKCTVFVPCGHLYCCTQCSVPFKRCPICSKAIGQKIKMSPCK
eukprot:TRINITY_DN1321_c0_g1_i4.p1 TRINITY_DN1321_c0_g1~~TRINITY_DN1321_c0_g1_i4.p1  ORF type:complete len:659 (-),score=133.19 TRINITY_DN1321_c0_g1_i4:13-1989(-)